MLLNGISVVCEQFPNGECKMKEPSSFNHYGNVIEFKYENDGDLIKLFFLKEWLDNKYFSSGHSNQRTVLIVDYMPYSRMDRYIQGDVFTLRYICTFINNLKFDQIIVIDPHSHKTLKMLDRAVEIVPIYKWLPNILKTNSFNPKKDIIVFPDEGAGDRYRLPNEYKDYKVCVFEKNRDAQTGKILGIKLKRGEVPTNSKCLIIDDLCSKGGTFTGVAKILKEKGADKIFLAVSHCEETIFQGSLLKPDSLISKIYTSTSMMGKIKNHPKIVYKEISLCL